MAQCFTGITGWCGLWLQETKSTVAQMMSDMKQQLSLVAPAAEAPIGSTSSRNTVLNSLKASKSFYRSTPGPVLAGSAAAGSAAIAHVGTGTSNNSSFVLTGSASSSSLGMVPNAAMLAMRRTTSSNSRLSATLWQQQQWQQQAFGELMQPQPLLQQVTAVDVARLRQVVPGAQAPCVSELAAAARAFPIGALSATGSATAGAIGTRAADIAGSLALSEPGTIANSVVLSNSRVRSGASAKGLGILLVPQGQEQQGVGMPASPCWTLAAGGRINGAAAVAAAGAAAGKSLVCDDVGSDGGRR